jgi:hypothetical protein
MRAQHTRRVTAMTLVIIEYGASWPAWLPPSSGDMAIVAQHYEGAPGSLLTQVASRLTRLEQGGWRLSRVVLVSNGRTDSEALGARSLLARGLLSRLAVAPHAELVLTHASGQGARSLGSLMALASSLEQSRAAATVQLVVREADSQVRGAAPLEESALRAG